MNNIYNDDCLELMKHIDDKSIDMILCDLPYGTTDIRGWDKIIPIKELWNQYKRIIKDNGSIVLFASQPFTSYLVYSNSEWFRYEWIWNKTKGANFLNSNHQPLKIHENILLFSSLPCSPNKKGTAKYFPQKTDLAKEYTYSDSEKRRNNVNGGRTGGIESKTLTGKMPISIQEFKKDGKLHPTQKPVALCEYLINTYTNPGDLVLDNCIGSGTTAIAALNTGRNFIGMELDPNYYEIAVKRVENHKITLENTKILQNTTKKLR